MIKIYTKPNCISCSRTKKRLAVMSVPFQEINIEEDAEARAQLMAEGWQSLPVVKTSITSWSGFQPEKLALLSNRM